MSGPERPAGVAPPGRRVCAVETLKKRSQFLQAQSGDKAGTSSFLLVRTTTRREADSARVGFTITRKVGKAVVRNRIRRRLREAARRVFPEFAEAGYDYVLIARPAAESRDFPLILDDMKRALLRLSARLK